MDQFAQSTLESLILTAILVIVKLIVPSKQVINKGRELPLILPPLLGVIRGGKTPILSCENLVLVVGPMSFLIEGMIIINTSKHPRPLPTFQCLFHPKIHLE